MKKLLSLFLLLVPLTSNAGTLLVANKSSHTVTLFNEETLQKIKELPVGIHPHEVTVSPDGEMALISNYGGGRNPGSTLTLINISEAKVSKTITLAKGSRPHGIQFLSPRVALVTAEGIQSLLVVNLNEGNVEQTIPLPGKGAHLMALDKQKNYAYITNTESGSVVKLDLSQWQVVAHSKIGKAAEGVALTEDEEKLLVTNRKDHQVSILNTQDLSLIKKVSTGKGPIRINLFDHGRSAVFTNCVGSTAQVLDLDSLSLASTFKTTHQYSFNTGKILGGFWGKLTVPITIVVKDDQTTAYIANSFAGNITLVDLQQGKVLKTFTASREPDGMAFSPVDVQSSEAEAFLEARKSELCSQKIEGECADLQGFKRKNTLWTSMVIEASPSQIWEVLMDFPQYKEWNSFMPYLKPVKELNDNSPLQVGDELVFKVDLGNFPTPYEKVKVQLKEDEKVLCWGSSPLGLLITQRCKHLQPLSDGRTLYYTTEKFRGVSAELIMKMVGQRIQVGIDKEANGLNNYLDNSLEN